MDQGERDLARQRHHELPDQEGVQVCPRVELRAPGAESYKTFLFFITDKEVKS